MASPSAPHSLHNQILLILLDFFLFIPFATYINSVSYQLSSEPLQQPRLGFLPPILPPALWFVLAGLLFLFFPFYLFIYLFTYLLTYLLTALGLHCCAWAFSSCGKQGLLFVTVHRLLIAVASLVAEHGP